MTALNLYYNRNRDFDLWRDFKSGDRAAFDRIFNQYINNLISYANKFTSDSSLVDDCIQDMFVYLWERRENLGDTNSIQKYLFKALRRRIFEALRKKRQFSDIAKVDLAHSAVDFKVHFHSKPELNQNHLNSMNSVFTMLSPIQKEIIYLKYYNELSFEEISEIVNCSKKSLYNYLSKSMMKFRKHLLG